MSQALIAIGMLALGTVFGWVARGLHEMDRRSQRERRIAEYVVESMGEWEFQESLGHWAWGDEHAEIRWPQA